MRKDFLVDPYQVLEARAAGAGGVILLSDIDGLYDRNPALPGANHLARVERIDKILMARHALSPFEAVALRARAEAFEAEAPDTVRFTRALKAAAALLEDGALEAARDERYGGWTKPEAKALLTGSLEEAAAVVTAKNLNPEPRSGRQERLENLWNRFI